MSSPQQVALIIDAENISFKDLPAILKLVSEQGAVVLKAVYGDWEKPHLRRWREAAEDAGFKIRHQASISNMKNSTDMRLIMEVIEIACRTKINTFCIVANDIDYAPLCNKLRELKKRAIVLGNPQVSEALIRASDVFIFINKEKEMVPPYVPQMVPEPDHMSNLDIEQSVILPYIPQTTPEPDPQPTQTIEKKDTARIQKILTKAFDQSVKDTDGWTTLSALGTSMRQVQGEINYLTHGYATLSKLLDSLPDFVELRGDNGTKSARMKSAIKPLIIEAFKLAPNNDNGWITLSALGGALRQVRDDFNCKHYGHATLSKLVKSYPSLVEIKEKGDTHWVRLKKA